MVFSLCTYSGQNYQNWAPAIANSWRVGPDIDHTPNQKTQWQGVLYELDLSARYPGIAGPKHWNDPDMMLLGVGTDGGRLVIMNDEEMKSHFSMWCMIAAPLILGNDLRDMSPQIVNIITNKNVIAIDQDKLGQQGIKLYEDGLGCEVWAKKLKSADSKEYAIALLNRTEKETDITIDPEKVGLTGGYKLQDVWLNKGLPKCLGKYVCKVPPHGVKLFIMK